MAYLYSHRPNSRQANVLISFLQLRRYDKPFTLIHTFYSLIYLRLIHGAMSNHLAVNLLRLPDNRRLHRFLPTDLPDRF
jgi:hypothetical protein